MIINVLARIRDCGIAKTEPGALERRHLRQVGEVKLDFPVEVGNRAIKIGGVFRIIGVEPSEYCWKEQRYEIENLRLDIVHVGVVGQRGPGSPSRSPVGIS